MENKTFTHLYLLFLMITYIHANTSANPNLLQQSNGIKQASIKFTVNSGKNSLTKTLNFNQFSTSNIKIDHDPFQVTSSNQNINQEVNLQRQKKQKNVFKAQNLNLKSNNIQIKNNPQQSITFNWKNDQKCQLVLNFLSKQVNIKRNKIQNVQFHKNNHLNYYNIFVLNQKGDILQFICTYNTQTKQIKYLKQSQKQSQKAEILSSKVQDRRQILAQRPISQLFDIIKAGNKESVGYETFQQPHKQQVTIKKISNNMYGWIGLKPFPKKQKIQIQFSLKSIQPDRVLLGVVSQSQLWTNSLKSSKYYSYDGFDCVHNGQKQIKSFVNNRNKHLFDLTMIRMVITKNYHIQWFSKNNRLIRGLALPLGVRKQNLYLKIFVYDNQSEVIIKLNH